MKNIKKARAVVRKAMPAWMERRYYFMLETKTGAAQVLRNLTQCGEEVVLNILGWVMGEVNGQLFFFFRKHLSYKTVCTTVSLT